MGWVKGPRAEEMYLGWVKGPRAEEMYLGWVKGWKAEEMSAGWVQASQDYLQPEGLLHTDQSPCLHLCLGLL